MFYSIGGVYRFGFGQAPFHRKVPSFPGECPVSRESTWVKWVVVLAGGAGEGGGGCTARESSRVKWSR